MYNYVHTYTHPYLCAEKWHQILIAIISGIRGNFFFVIFETHFLKSTRVALGTRVKLWFFKKQGLGVGVGGWRPGGISRVKGSWEVKAIMETQQALGPRKKNFISRVFCPLDFSQQTTLTLIIRELQIHTLLFNSSSHKTKAQIRSCISPGPAEKSEQRADEAWGSMEQCVLVLCKLDSKYKETNSLVAQWAKEPALPLLWRGFSPWPGNFHVP